MLSGTAHRILEGARNVRQLASLLRGTVGAVNWWREHGQGTLAAEHARILRQLPGS